MKARRLLGTPAAWLASSSVATVIVVACTSTVNLPASNGTVCATGDSVACVCADGSDGVGKCGDPASCVCTGSVADSGGVSTKDGGADVDSGYGVCARQGSFGWPCNVANANDPTNCTDPKFPFCFQGGKGSWCTTACDDDAGGFAACLVEAPDAGGADAEAGTAIDAGAAAEAGAAEEAGAAIDAAAAVDAAVASDAGEAGAATDAGALEASTAMECVPTACNTRGYCQ